MRNLVVLEDGKCICKHEPRGKYCGLEGYMLGDEYRYQKVKSPTEEYYRIYPPNGEEMGYYETCDQKSFRFCFDKKEAHCAV